MGIGDGHQVVVYDSPGLFSAPRAWWTFRLFGKTDVAVLDGGLPKWHAQGRPVETGWPSLRDRHFTARRDAGPVRERHPGRRRRQSSVTPRSSTPAPPSVSAARSRSRGPGLRSGHIPGSRNLPWRRVDEPRRHHEGRPRPPRRLRGRRRRCRRSLSSPHAAPASPRPSSASGWSASATAAALDDGSWAEWGAYGDLKVETG